MKLQKKKGSGIIVGLILALPVLFLALHGAGAYKDTQIKAPGTRGIDIFNLFVDAFESRLQIPLNIEWNEFSRDFILWCGFTCFILIAYYSTSKKNYISGKEYGTSRWGGRGDIKPLYAKNILKRELTTLALQKIFITRYFAGRRAMKRCEDDGRKHKAFKLELLGFYAEQEKANGSLKKRLYAGKIKQIDIEVNKSVYDAKAAAWKPFKLKSDYHEMVQALKTLRQQNHLTTEEYNKRIANIRTEYKKELAEFYRGTGRIAELKRMYRNADAILTKTERVSIYNHEVNNNTLVLGGSGSGKTRGFVIPNILQAHSSYVITDPKGEILEKVGYFLRELNGYDIRVLNLDNKQKSDGYNPFVYVHPEREGYEERILTLIKTIIINTDGGEKRNSSDPFWEKAEELFLQAMFFFTCDGFLPAERNMNTVLSLISMLQIAEEEDRLQSDLDYFAKIFEKEHGSGHIGVQQYKEFRTKASGKTAKSIVISAVARLAPFRTEAVRKIFSYDTMELYNLGEKKMAVFVVVPPTDNTFNFIAGMLFTQMFQELQYCATQVHKYDGQRLRIPVRFILDEFANTCTIPNFIKILAYARSFGIGIAPILQSLEQIKTMYKDEWGVIIDNCSARLFLGSISHMDTLEYISKLLGKETFDKRTTGRSRGRHGSTSQNWDVTGRELLYPAEISKMPKDDCLLLISNHYPFYSKKYEYTKHPNYRYTSDGNRSYSFHYKPLINPLDYEPAQETTHSGAAGNDVKTDDAVIMPQPSPNSVVTQRDITLVTNPHEVLSDLIKSVKYQAPIPDGLFCDDGEPLYTNDESKTLLSLLEENKEDKESLDNLIAATSNINSISLNTDITEISSDMSKSVKHLVPIPDDLFATNDGEPKYNSVEKSVLLHSIENIIFDDENGLCGEDIIEAAGGPLNELIDRLPPDMLDLEYKYSDSA